MHEVLVNSLGGPSLPRKSVVRLTDHPDMTIGVHRRCKTQHTTKQQQPHTLLNAKVHLWDGELLIIDIQI